MRSQCHLFNYLLRKQVTKVPVHKLDTKANKLALTLPINIVDCCTHNIKIRSINQSINNSSITVALWQKEINLYCVRSFKGEEDDNMNNNYKKRSETHTLHAMAVVRTPRARPLSQTHRQDRLQYTAPQRSSAQCNNMPCPQKRL